MANSDSKGICVSRSVWFVKPEKTDRPVLESCRKAAIPAFSWAIHGRLEYSCFGLASDEGGDIYGVIELIWISIMKNGVDVKLFDSFHKQNFIRFRDQTETILFCTDFFLLSLWTPLLAGPTSPVLQTCLCLTLQSTKQLPPSVTTKSIPQCPDVP